jgi:thioredoxin-like negative regulator of GroEL
VGNTTFLQDVKDSATDKKLKRMSDAAEHSNISFVKVDVDKHPTIAQENAIRAMPTFLFFKGGKMNEKPVQGANPRALTELVAKAKAAGETQTGQASSS